MKKLTFSALTLMMALTALVFTSCDSAEIKDSIVANNIPMSGGQVVPVANTNASGTINATYDPNSRVLSYTISWQNLAGPVANMTLQGPADGGGNAGVLQNIIAASNGVVRPGTSFGATGSYTGTVVMDGTLLKETELLTNRYFFVIRTASFPNGELRGQLIMRR